MTEHADERQRAGSEKDVTAGKQWEAPKLTKFPASMGTRSDMTMTNTAETPTYKIS